MTVIEQAIESYGKDMQLNVAIEEMSELIKEICKNKRGADNIESITEELADCHIMMDQIQIIFGIDDNDLYQKIQEKIFRLSKQLGERSENGT